MRGDLLAREGPVTAAPAAVASPKLPPVTAPTSATEAPVRELEAITVSGVQPGPGLWRVRNGDHLLYILGTQSPLPKRMTWRSDEVEQVLQVVDRVLGSPGVQVDADVGFFRGMLLLPSAMKAAKNPGDQRLQDVLPADTYARWARLKQRYLGRDTGIEKKRPLIAVFQLYQEALSRSGLKERNVIEPVLEAALKKRKLKITPATLKLMIEDPKQAIADFRKEPLKPVDLECFNRTLDRIEFELPRMTARANAWAVGDVAALRSQPTEAQQLACLSAWFDTDVARKRGLTDLDVRVRETWLGQADLALRESRITFATVGIGELLKPGGYLAQLQARGYTVEAPE
ncbi:TraB/GumN family protein [Pseudoxanthomonas indica]